MTVAELIAALDEIEDKTLPVFRADCEYGYISTDYVKEAEEEIIDFVLSGDSGPYVYTAERGVFLD